MNKLFILSLMTIGVFSCARVPLTGRKTMALIPESTMQSLSLTEYRGFLTKNPPVKGTPDADLVNRVGVRLTKAVKDYMASKNLSAQLNGYTWDFNLINNKELNAWCMPGAKVVVFAGILPVTANEAGLAAVLVNGHNILFYRAMQRYNKRYEKTAVHRGIAGAGSTEL